MENSEEIEELPQEVEFPDYLKGRIHYDPTEKLLIFKGIMTEQEKNDLLNLSTAEGYQKAIEVLYHKSRMKFFVVHTYTGRERRVKDLLKKEIEKQSLKTLFDKDGVILPTEKVMKIKKSEVISEERRLYPGYIIVKMEPTEEALKIINSIPGVTHILGTRNKPLPISEQEVTEILNQERPRKEAVTEAPFTKGENVKVIAGPFSGFTGTIEEINLNRRRVKIVVTIFGRPTPIDLDFLEVQPI